LKIAACIAIALVAAPALAGVVQTLGARIEGDVKFADGRLEAAGKTVPWNEVLYAAQDRVQRTLSAAGAVHLAGGEVWRADILSLSGKRLALRSALLGAREIDPALVSALDFLAPQPRGTGSAWAETAPRPAAGATGTLYRDKGEPVPGTLLWIDETRLAIDSPLGVLTLAREGLVRYEFPAGRKAATATGLDEVGLVDGTVIRGSAKPVPGGVAVEHAVLGTLRLGDQLIRFVARQPAGVIDLGSRPPSSVTQSGILDKSGPSRPAAIASERPCATGTAKSLTALRLEPKTVMKWDLRGEAGKPSRLSGRICPIEGARGDAHLRILAGGKTILEKDIGPGAAVEPLALDLAAAQELAVEVDFGPRIGFPCGIVLEDPIVVAAPR